MNVVVTIVFFAAAALWGFAVYNRLMRLRERVKEATDKIRPIQLISPEFVKDPYPVLEILRETKNDLPDYWQ